MTNWYKSTYDKSKFKMNNRRSLDMISAEEEVLEYLSLEDARDVNSIANNLMHGHLSTAINLYNRLDTIVRDYMPQWLSELAGAEINPAYYKYENSLEGTEEE